MNILNNKLLREHGIIHVSRPIQKIPKSSTKVGDDLYLNEDGTLTMKLKGVHATIVTDNEVIDTYVYPVSNESLIKAANDIKNLEPVDLPSSGPISMSQVNNELHQHTTGRISINETDVRYLADKDGVNTRISFSDLRGKRDQFVIYLNGRRQNVRISDYMPSDKRYNTIRVVVHQRAVIYSSSTSIPAMDFNGTKANNLIIDVQDSSTVCGRGGDGGRGRQHADIHGKNGGPAVHLRSSGIKRVTLNINHGSELAGGGGGGGGGGYDRSGRAKAGGGGGGGGAGYGVGGIGDQHGGRGGNGTARNRGMRGNRGKSHSWGRTATGGYGGYGGYLGERGQDGQRKDTNGVGGQPGQRVASNYSFTTYINR